LDVHDVSSGIAAGVCADNCRPRGRTESGGVDRAGAKKWADTVTGSSSRSEQATSPEADDGAVQLPGEPPTGLLVCYH
jgi:hypothetical protein